MHDVGKIGTPAEIPGPLDRDERREMEHHAEFGHEILTGSESELLRMAARIALTHHERYDGSGYPHGLSGEEIPIEGRITAVADVFDALLSERCYRPAMSLEQVLELFEEGRGTQFDPAAVDALFADLDGCRAIVS
jgi:putative two-component system response regulator